MREIKIGEEWPKEGPWRCFIELTDSDVCFLKERISVANEILKDSRYYYNKEKSKMAIDFLRMKGIFPCGFFYI